MGPGFSSKIAVLCVVLGATLQIVSGAACKQPRVACNGGKYMAAHEECCAFYALRDDLQENLFDNECGDAAHEVLRLSFHDAIGYSQSGKYKGSGADGSLITFSDTELSYITNIGIDDPVHDLKPFLARHTVTAGDLIQFASAVGLSNCPGAPRLEFRAGRPNAIEPASEGTVPSPIDSADVLIARMADAGFSPEELVQLLASHSVARSSHVDKTLQHVPLDSTPGEFDSQFFLEVLLKGEGFPGNGSGNPLESSSALYAEGEMRLQSDYVLAHDSRTACTWQSMINNQRLMMKGFRSAMAKLAVTGQDKSKLIDCSDVIPKPKSLKTERAVSAAYPAGQCFTDVQQSCPYPFPSLSITFGQPSAIPYVP